MIKSIHEGKNEINARIGYFKLGVNLKTETPKPEQMRKAVRKVLSDETYRNNVIKLAKEFAGYNPNELCAYYLKDILQKTGRLFLNKERQEEKVY